MYLSLRTSCHHSVWNLVSKYLVYVHYPFPCCYLWASLAWYWNRHHSCCCFSLSACLTVHLSREPLLATVFVYWFLQFNLTWSPPQHWLGLWHKNVVPVVVPARAVSTSIMFSPTSAPQISIIDINSDVCVPCSYIDALSSSSLKSETSTSVMPLESSPDHQVKSGKSVFSSEGFETIIMRTWLGWSPHWA